jgi:hypothetical protein
MPLVGALDFPGLQVRYLDDGERRLESEVEPAEAFWVVLPEKPPASTPIPIVPDVEAGSARCFDPLLHHSRSFEEIGDPSVVVEATAIGAERVSVHEPSALVFIELQGFVMVPVDQEIGVPIQIHVRGQYVEGSPEPGRAIHGKTGVKSALEGNRPGIGFCCGPRQEQSRNAHERPDSEQRRAAHPNHSSIDPRCMKLLFEIAQSSERVGKLVRQGTASVAGRLAGGIGILLDQLE